MNRARGTRSCAYLLLALVLAVGCGAKTGIVRLGPHRPKDEPPPERVLKPPPPAKVETLPLRRNKKCFYRDGEWRKLGNSWKWEKGEWILPPPNCYYAPPQTRYEDLEVGPALVHRKGVWLPMDEGDPACADPAPCPPAQKD